jgi:hypothetical protein
MSIFNVHVNKDVANLFIIPEFVMPHSLKETTTLS